MKKTDTRKKAIAYTNLPPSLRLGMLIVIWLLMDRLGAAQWGFCLFYLFAAYIVISGFYQLRTVELVDLFAPRADIEPQVQPAKPTSDEKHYTLISEAIEIERDFIDRLTVRLLDGDGNTMYAFEPRLVGLGECLRLTDMRAQLKVRYSH